MEFYSIIKKNEFRLFIGKWIELEIIKLSKASQMQKDRYHLFSLICKIYIKRKKSHESRKGTIWEEKGDQQERGG
jgi:hypothetical protein